MRVITSAVALAAEVGDALGEAIRVRERESEPGWVRVQIEWHDEAHPLVLDVLASTAATPSRVVYMLPGGALNFAGNFFTPRHNNLVHFMHRHGYLVVGVTPREDSLTPATNEPAAQDWGLAKHRQDLSKVVTALGQGLHLPYDVLGHSAGGVLALAYAATASQRLGRVMVLDTTGPFDPLAEPELRGRAGQARDTLTGMLADSTYIQDAASGTKRLLKNAIERPSERSPLDRPQSVGGGQYTWAGLLHFALIHTRETPGIAHWIYEPGLVAGTYTYGPDAASDTFTFQHTMVPTITEAFAQLGSGGLPTALLRDLFSVWTGDAGLIDFGAIGAEVVWVNMALGRGDHLYGARLIEEGGNPHVTFTVVPGYGHGDPVWGGNAAHDIWPLFFRS